MSPCDHFSIDTVIPGGYTSGVRISRFADKGLEALEKTDAPGYSPAIIKAFRKRIQVIRGAKDERDFYALKSLCYEKLKGKRSHQHSMRLNDQFRLILEYEGTGQDKTVQIIEITDYHD